MAKRDRRRQKIGNMERKSTPKKKRPEEKEKASAQYPIAGGMAPPPRRKPMNMTRDTAVLLKWEGKIRERVVKPTGNRQAVEEACRKSNRGVVTKPGRNPSRSVNRPVVVKNMVMAL
jgi:hypothetical protein